MRRISRRAYALTFAVLAYSLAAPPVLADIFSPPPLPIASRFQAEPETTPSDATEAFGESAQADCHCGQPDCPTCCEPCCVPCCTSCCDDPCASWTFSAGWLYLNRSDPDDALLFFNPSVESETVNASDFDFGWQSGVEFGITKHNLIWDVDLEARVWGVDGWTSQTSASLSGPTTGIATNPELQVLGPRDVASTYTSEIGSLEFNLKRRSHHVPRWTWIAGFRMLELDENLNSLFTDPNQDFGTFDYRVSTRNRLYGFQLGGELDLISSCRWCVRGFAKAGIYGNEANNSSAADCLTFEECIFNANQNKSRTAFVGEAGISVRYCFCENLAVRADYRAVWVDGVALASEQVNATNYLDFTGASTSGDVFYHGSFLGLEYTY